MTGSVEVRDGSFEYKQRRYIVHIVPEAAVSVRTGVADSAASPDAGL